MICATRASPDHTDLGRARGLERNSSTESGITVYVLGSPIRTRVRPGHYLQSGQSDQSADKSLDTLNRAYSRVWINLWYGLHSLNRALSIACIVRLEPFQSRENLIVAKSSSQKKLPIPKKKDMVKPVGLFF